MLKKIELHNFLSYENLDLNFDSVSDTYLVVGDNGAGKSTIFEAVLYALYGRGRSSVQRLARDGGDGSVRVKVTIESNNDLIVVERARSKRGVGSALCSVNGIPVAKGAGVEGWVEKHFATDINTYLLTSFFGLGETDTLMKVRSSVRLETLQSIANVSIYTDVFLPAVKRKQKEDEERKVMIKTEIRDLSSFSEAENIQKLLREKKVEYRDQQNRLTALYSEQGSLISALESCRAFTKEADILKIKLSDLKREHQKVLNDLNSAKSEVRRVENNINRVHEALSNQQALVKSKGPAENVKKKLDKVVEKVGNVKAAVKLRRVALEQAEHVTTCPLCGNPVEKNIINRWQTELVDFQDDLEGLIKQKGELKEVWRKVLKAEEAIRSSVQEIARLKRSREEEENQLSLLKTSERSLRDKISRITNRFEKVAEKVKGRDSSTKALDLLNKSISVVQESIGSLKQEIKHLQDKLKEVNERKQQIRSKKAQLKKLQNKLAAWKILIDAFSRYGIPADLMRGLCSEIESRATQIYRRFATGRVLVKEVEDRGKPGIEFVLLLQDSERYYSELSEGQKVMLFLSVRLAISDILRKSFPVTADFLVLDEVTGHLSEQKREELAFMIKSTLKGVYKQIFLISHSSIRNIFSREIKVMQSGGKSKVVVA